MTRVVVDTNVPISANGRETHASEECQLKCIEKIKEIISRKVIVLDDQDLIFEEYKRYLNFSGEPGVGDLFFKYIFNSYYHDDKIHLASITPSSDSDKGFEQLPPNTLDPSDRKFLASAVESRATLINALDPGWGNNTSLLKSLGVRLEEICPEHI